MLKASILTCKTLNASLIFRSLILGLTAVLRLHNGSWFLASMSTFGVKYWSLLTSITVEQCDNAVYMSVASRPVFLKCLNSLKSVVSTQHAED